MIGATIVAAILILGFVAVGLYFVTEFIKSLIKLDGLSAIISGIAVIMYIGIVLMLYGV